MKFIEAPTQGVRYQKGVMATLRCRLHYQQIAPYPTPVPLLGKGPAKSTIFLEGKFSQHQPIKNRRLLLGRSEIALPHGHTGAWIESVARPRSEAHAHGCLCDLRCPGRGSRRRPVPCFGVKLDEAQRNEHVCCFCGAPY